MLKYGTVYIFSYPMRAQIMTKICRFEVYSRTPTLNNHSVESYTDKSHLLVCCIVDPTTGINTIGSSNLTIIVTHINSI